VSISCTDSCKKLRFSGFVGPIVSTKGKTFFGFNVKRLLLLWMRGKGPRHIRMSAQNIEEISNRLTDLAKFVPKRFARKPRKWIYSMTENEHRNRDVTLFSELFYQCI
jgi:hypothetical protein